MSGGTFSILIAALGGEGGGTLMNWIVEAATKAGLPVQATSVPGVAQRTGSTSYYIEMARAPAGDGKTPIFALVPMPGRVDVVIASELAEAGRMIERGFVSPPRTLLIASSSRVYTTAEKMQMGDGRFASEALLKAAGAMAQRFVELDLEALARTHGTMVSATMFGALAGSGALPFDPALCEATIGTGRGAKASLAGFAAAFEAAQDGARRPPEIPEKATAPADPALPAAMAYLPEGLRAVAALGHARTLDFQDEAYAALYIKRVRSLSDSAQLDDPRALHSLEEAARRLALWMAYEDIPRVAELKSRPERFAAIKREAEMKPGQILRVVDYFKPGGEEIAAMLPKALGERLMRRLARGKSLPFLGRDLYVPSSSISGFLTLRFLASFKRIRRASLRFSEEQAAIEEWLEAMRQALYRSTSFSGALAELPRLLKGYGDTHLRGRRNYARLMRQVVEPALADVNLDLHADALRKGIAAALNDPEGTSLDTLLAARAAERRPIAHAASA